MRRLRLAVVVDDGHGWLGVLVCRFEFVLGNLTREIDVPSSAVCKANGKGRKPTY